MFCSRCCCCSSSSGDNDIGYHNNNDDDDLVDSKLNTIITSQQPSSNFIQKTNGTKFLNDDHVSYHHHPLHHRFNVVCKKRF